MKTNRIKWACYLCNISMSAVAMLSPLLLVTFNKLYNISYSLLGLLVLINFMTQLSVDLLFTFFSKHFNIPKTIKLTPVLTSIGFLTYALIPMLFESYAYLGLILGTIIFSAASGLNEVLTSPLVAVLPSDNHEKDVSALHSTYAWGVVGVVIIGSIYLYIFDSNNWYYFPLVLSVIPILSTILFTNTVLPEINVTDDKPNNKNKIPIDIILCAIAIFFGGATECTMTQWSSSFIESAIGIPKIIGDIFGVSLFAIMLGVGRTLYTRYGKNIINVMIICSLGALICYLCTGLIINSVLSMIFCILTGLCVSMLWPGIIILIGEKYKNTNVYIYALMAAFGDLGAALVPQFVGIVIDKIEICSLALEIANTFNINTLQVAMRSGILLASIFPLLGFIMLLIIKKHYKKLN